MTIPRPRLLIASFALAALAATGAVAYALLGPPALLAWSDSPEFCAACHLHDGHYEAWLHETPHRQVSCSGCHLPNRNPVSHYFWKGVDGNRDLALFFANAFRDRIGISAHGRHVVQDNCLRCHEGMTSRIDRERRCVDCHRRMFHVRPFMNPVPDRGERR